MRTLNATLLASQKAMGDAKAKLTLSKSGETTLYYYIDSGDDVILAIDHIEKQWSQMAQVVIKDVDNTIRALDLHGWLGYIGWGYGSNYSEAAPLEVISQTSLTVEDDLLTYLGLAGVFDMMDKEHAKESYEPEHNNTDTIKTILIAIATATMSSFIGTKTYTIIFDAGYDAGDDLTNTVQPKDYFRVIAGETRLRAFKRALAWTGCVARVEYDGAIHISVPTTTGTTYAYEYNDEATEHNFFDKSVRKRVVLPNYQLVSSHPDHEDQYTGFATDSDSYAALGRYLPGTPKYIRAASNAQCTSIAEAMIANYQLDAERGSGFAPMNCGQEIMDYVKITDSWAGDTRVGNVGYIHRKYRATGEPKDFSMRFGFGNVPPGGFMGAAASAAAGGLDYRETIALLRSQIDSIWDFLENTIIPYLELMQDYFPDVIPKLYVYREMRIPNPRVRLE